MSRFWSAPAHWPGETVFIVGGGPSLENFDLTGLAGRRVIAVNNAFKLLPEADIIFFADTRWWRWYGAEIPLDYKGRIVSVCKMADKFRDPRILRMGRDYRFDVRTKNPNPVFLSDDPTALSGPDSGYMAINLAYLFGATRIVLLGFDMGFSDGKAHWHEDHQVPTPESNYSKLFLPTYPALIEALQARGVEVMRCTPSKLDCVPEFPLDQVLALPYRQNG